MFICNKIVTDVQSILQKNNWYEKCTWCYSKLKKTEDKMAGWHHRLDGHEFGWTLGAGNGQGGLACCDSWGCKESDTTERLDWTELNWDTQYCSYNFKYICENIGTVKNGKLFIEIINNHQLWTYISHMYFLFNVLWIFMVL